MYEIFFHVSGIALLEISFFFYYIGPKETEMFLHYIKRILDSSLFDLVITKTEPFSAIFKAKESPAIPDPITK